MNYVPIEVPQEEEAPQWVKYEEELEINDLPQQLRWRITSRVTKRFNESNVSDCDLLQETLTQIQEYADVGMTVRGTYVQPGKQPPEGDRKLFLSIESTNELAISKAKAEIMRLLKEEFRRQVSYQSN